MDLRTADADATRRLVARLGRLAPAGTVVALVGDLGAGKTAFAQGVGEGLGIADVQSPTFVLVSEHEGRLPLVHADLYRLDDPLEVEQLGLEERLEEGNAVALVEWADLHPEVLPEDHLRVEILHEGEGRRLRCSATGPVHARLLEAWRG